MPPWSPSQQLLHLSWWSSSTVCGLGPGPPMLKGQFWLSCGSCVEYPCIAVAVPLFASTTGQLAIHYVFGQSSIRHSCNMSSPAQLGWHHHGSDCRHSSLGKDLSVGDIVLPGDLHQEVYVSCCNWSIWCKFLWYGHHVSHPYSRVDMTTAVHTLHLDDQPDVLWPGMIFQLTKGKADYSGFWLHLHIQGSCWWHYAAHVAEHSDRIEMSVINKDSWFFTAWARSWLVQNISLFQADSQSKVFSCTGKMTGDLLYIFKWVGNQCTVISKL